MTRRRLGLVETRRRAAGWAAGCAGNVSAAPGGRIGRLGNAAGHEADQARAREGGERHEGFDVGRYLQTPPLMFTADHHPLWLGDLYRGRPAFLICGGPSFARLNHAPLRGPGMLTMAVNNAVRTFRPNLWASVDNPANFIWSTWLDPTILKFVPICHADQRIFDSDAWQWMNLSVRDCPAVFHFKRNERFQPEQFLWEDTINWGNHKRFGGGRSVMLVALRVLFILGVREVYLLGADFSMSHNYTYHFEQSRSASAVRDNMSIYGKMNKWFTQLRPLFEREGFRVFNCNPESRLTAFDYLSYDAAIERASTAWGGVDVQRERTDGQYSDQKPVQEGP